MNKSWVIELSAYWAICAGQSLFIASMSPDALHERVQMLVPKRFLKKEKDGVLVNEQKEKYSV